MSEVVADPLSETLALIDARCVVSGAFTAGGAWAVSFRPRARLKIVAVERGSCWISVEGGGPPVELVAGDVAVLNGWAQVYLAAAGDQAVDPQEILSGGRGEVAVMGDGSATTVVVGGHVEVNQAGEDLLVTALPRVSCIRGGTREARVIAWVLENMLREMGSALPGTAMLRHLHAQTLLLETLRAYLDDVSAVPAGWLRLSADVRLAPAVRAMHADPGRSWSLEDLARLAAMSRTTFVERFRAAAGVPPMTYLQQWRIRLAERELRAGDVAVGRLAARLGYGSESSFSTAFKKATGSSPRTYRESTRADLAVTMRPPAGPGEG